MKRSTCLDSRSNFAKAGSWTSTTAVSWSSDKFIDRDEPASKFSTATWNIPSISGGQFGSLAKSAFLQLVRCLPLADRNGSATKTQTTASVPVCLLVGKEFMWPYKYVRRNKYGRCCERRRYKRDIWRSMPCIMTTRKPAHRIITNNIVSGLMGRRHDMGAPWWIRFIVFLYCASQFVNYSVALC